MRFIATALFAALLACSALGQETTTVSLEDDGRALINPQMGWTMHFYSNIPSNYGSKLAPSDSLDWFEGCSTIYLRLPWAYLEPEEGVFNWAIVDTPAQRWIAKGKKVAFRFTASENWLEYATPKWVFDAGAESIRYTWGKGPDPEGKTVDPVFDDPIFLEKLERFLAAAGARYNGNPDIAFIDVGSYGMWGEGHTSLGVWDVAKFQRAAPERALATIKKHIDLHRKYFPDVLLCVSDDVAGPEEPGFDFPETDYALSQNVSLRDDSILVSPINPWFHADMAQKFWPKLPVILEHEHFNGSQERGAWNDEKLIESIEAYHASYMSIHWFPDVEWDELKETVRKINRRIGYRILPSKVEYPSEIQKGEPFQVSWTLQNVGVAPCYPGGFVALTLKDAEGGIVSVLSDESFDVRDLPVAKPGEAPKVDRETTFRVGLVAPTTKPGTYGVYLSVGRRDGTPTLELPIPGDDGQKRYKIGTIVVK